MENSKNLKVIRLDVENVLGIKAISITPKTNVVQIEGKNGAGKSSAIDAIWIAIGGANEMPDNPIRNGEKKGEITVDLGDIAVTKKFLPSGATLEVRNADGYKASSPQKLLDSLYTKVSYDPLLFINMRPKDRREILLELSGQKEQLENIANKRKEYYDERTIVGRDVKNLEGKLSDAPNEDPNVKEVSVSDLLEELNRQEGIENKIRELKNGIDESETTIQSYNAEIEQLETRIRVLKEGIDSHNANITQAKEKLSTAPTTNIEEIRTQISQADEVNKKVREIIGARKLREELVSTKSKYESLTNKISECDDSKQKILSGSSLPIDGVTFEEDSIQVNNIPFDDLSTSERIRIAMKIGMAQNPQLRVLRISQGSELDKSSMEDVKKFAEENDVQVWVEKVCDAPQSGFFISEGEIAGADVNVSSKDKNPVKSKEPNVGKQEKSESKNAMDW